MQVKSKISDKHLDRFAYVYVRQSTQFQVEHNLESQRRQYDLVNRAKGLGWKNVEIIDEDLGCSGSGAVARKGFERLVSMVSMGKAGAVFSLEASRLARNNRDWHHLIDICAMVHTLIIDQDGIYDPGVLNDRLLLGLKGTMSEFELSLLRQRTFEGLRLKANRGELYTIVPVGYIRTKDNRCEKDPDERICSAVALVFDKFDQMRSVRQVLLWFTQEKMKLPTIKYDAHGREIIWKAPIYSTLIKFLSNPIYAGAYVFGKTATETYIENGRVRKKSGKKRPQDKWDILIKDHHKCYISWETYERNRAQIHSNANMKGLMRVNGAARSGSALLAGLLRCSRCGRKIRVSYTKSEIRYVCRAANLAYGAAPCISFSGIRVDAEIENQILDIVQPAALEAAIRAEDKKKNDVEQKHKSLELELEQAEYEAQRAFRQYNSVDPENRLVAGELERRWNDSIRIVNESKLALEKVDDGDVSPKRMTYDELKHLADTLPEIWRHEQTDMRIKKLIVRTLIKEIIVNIDKNPEFIHLTIHWHGGEHSTVDIKRGRTGVHRYTTDKETVQLVQELSLVMPDSAIAATLNRLGRKTGRGNSWTQQRVDSLRNHNNIPPYNKNNAEGVVTQEKASEILQISPMSVHRLISNGIIESRQIVPCSPHLIKEESLKELKVLEAANKIRNRIRAPLPEDPNQQCLNFN